LKKLVKNLLTAEWAVGYNQMNYRYDAAKKILQKKHNFTDLQYKDRGE
jgi:hypothetical protein